MRTLLQTLFPFFLVTQICFAQWFEQTSGTNNNLNAVQFMDTNNGIAVGDSGTMLKTVNGGTSWIPITTGITNNFSGMCFADVNNGWVATCGNEFSDTSIVLHTSDGGLTWSPQIKIAFSNLSDITFISASTGFAVGSAWDPNWFSFMLGTTDGGLNWSQTVIDDTIGGIPKICFVDANNGWGIRPGGAPREGSKIYVTTDAGNSWLLQLYTGSSNDATTLHDIAFTDPNNGIAVGNTMMEPWLVIYKTTDGGTTWDWISSDFGSLNSVFLFNADEGIAVGGNRVVINQSTIIRTSDGWSSWEDQISGTTNSLSDVYFIDDLNGWIVGDNGTILHTTNGGLPVELTSLTASSNGKEVILSWSTATELNNHGFEVQRSTEGTEFFTVGFVNGHGTTTEQHNYSYEDRNLNNGKYYYRLKQVDYDGSYEYSDVVEVEWRTFNSYLLEQNYPNPFNPSTTIGFGVQEKLNVKITILNSIGEEVAVAMNEEREPGFHQVEFNAANLPSGVYFYQLKAGSYVDTKKMVLMK